VTELVFFAHEMYPTQQERLQKLHYIVLMTCQFTEPELEIEKGGEQH
jgi:hypothetical protein